MQLDNLFKPNVTNTVKSDLLENQANMRYQNSMPFLKISDAFPEF